jgi:hypothetical protein
MDDIIKERLNWLKHQIDSNGRYHDHKETMAWVATTFYLTGILYWAYKVHSFHLTIAGKGVYSFLFALAGYLFFVFVKWQFKKRWIAHQRVWYHVKDVEGALFFNDAIPLPTEDRKIKKERKDYLIAFRDIFCMALCQKGRLCDQLEPIVSEVLTYIAIISTIVFAIVLVNVH